MGPVCCACGALIADADENSLRHGECFKCRIQGIRFTFVGGGGYGRETFHNGTTAEFDRSIRDGAKANGIEIDRAPR